MSKDFLNSVSKFFEGIPKFKILCIGDVILDRFVRGSTERISPEAPIPILKIEKEDFHLGGAGNVIRNLSALGVKTDFFSIVGNDINARKIKELLKAQKNVKYQLFSQGRKSTPLKTRFISSNQQLLRTDQETTEEASIGIQSNMLARIKRSLKDCSALIISDYGKGTLSSRILSKVIKDANRKNVPIIVDPKGLNYKKYNGSHVVTPNLHELSQATQMSVKNQKEIISASRYLLSRHQFKFLVVTQSSKGMSVVCKNPKSKVVHLSAETREVYDVSGAGDTVVAVLAILLGAGYGIVDAARISNIAAGIVVEKAQTAVVFPYEILSRLRDRSLSFSAKKVMDLATIKENINLWRQKGMKIGFTNGCFDLIHPGHIFLIEQAKKECDKLIVAINNDNSVRLIKGKSRPIQSDYSRASVLSALESVDAVIIFSEKTPFKLIKFIRPNVLVKGSDYKIGQVVGGNFVRKYGGRVKIVDLLSGFSSSKTISLLGS